jgi:hypothetical protein
MVNIEKTCSHVGDRQNIIAMIILFRSLGFQIYIQHRDINGDRNENAYVRNKHFP